MTPGKSRTTASSRHNRRRLAAREDIVADGDFAQVPFVDDALVHAFKTATDDEAARTGGKFADQRLRQGFAPRAHEQARALMRAFRQWRGPEYPVSTPCRHHRLPDDHPRYGGDRWRNCECPGPSATTCPRSSARPASEWPSVPGNMSGNSVRMVAAKLIPESWTGRESLQVVPA